MFRKIVLKCKKKTYLLANQFFFEEGASHWANEGKKHPISCIASTRNASVKKKDISTNYKSMDDIDELVYIKSYIPV